MSWRESCRVETACERGRAQASAAVQSRASMKCRVLRSWARQALRSAGAIGRGRQGKHRQNLRCCCLAESMMVLPALMMCGAGNGLPHETKSRAALGAALARPKQQHVITARLTRLMLAHSRCNCRFLRRRSRCCASGFRNTEPHRPWLFVAKETIKIYEVRRQSLHSLRLRLSFSTASPFLAATLCRRCSTATCNTPAATSTSGSASTH